GQGVFTSNNAGASWISFSNGLTNVAGCNDIELAIQNIGGVTTLFAGVATGSTLNGVFQNTAGAWTALSTPPAAFNAGSGFAEKFQIAADPVNAGVVYIDGQGGTGVFRYDPAGAGNWVQIDMTGTQTGTSPHADSRDLAFLGSS